MYETATILCVDDEENVLKALSRLFMEDNIRVLTALSGAEGLEILASEPNIQVVLSDYRMPEMNGVEFLKEVRSHWPETIRIIISGYPDIAAVVEAINDGQVFKFVPKPWKNDELKVLVRNALYRYDLLKKYSRQLLELKEANASLCSQNKILEAKLAEKDDALKFDQNTLGDNKNILESLPMGVFKTDQDENLIYINAMGCKLLNLEQSTALGSPVFDVISPELFPQIKKTMIEPPTCNEITLKGHRYTLISAQSEHLDHPGVILVLVPYEKPSAH